ncbi:COR domain-containing protein [Candidatus Albibeggiatoa sp. nov. BB20]|uniref:COR domain-containing protein n=1 Tax=Candidatus Albibeggiatoa sp. nov. BB20 TaxID=3162723 RepID=UPI003365A56F
MFKDLLFRIVIIPLQQLFITLISPKPNIIKQLEQELGVKLNKYKIVEWDSQAYQINLQQQVIALSLYKCKIKQIPECLCTLSYLKELYLVGNKIAELPESFGQLQNLSVLYLNENQLKELPASFGQLQNLSQLYLNENQLKELPASFGQLQNLSVLYLDGNQLKELPASFGQLQNLSKLYLDGNQLKELPASFGQLQNLSDLSLNNNQLKELPTSFRELKNLCGLRIYDNPLETPPYEIAAKGIKAIRNYFEQLEQGDGIIYEAKVLILGEGAAGKTSLANKIIDSNYTLKSDEKSTEGIDIHPWKFPINENRNFIANIWDFGGQEIYHATHQFFLTKRSLYILVADTRKQDTKFEYWLQIVELLADDSPIIIIKNEKQDRPCDINESRLKGRFKQLKHIQTTNLDTNRNLESILQQLQLELKNLNHVGSKLPKTWIDVRQTLENDNRNYISLDEFLNLCEQNGFTRQKDKLQLSGYLHDLGTSLHFQNDPLLNKTIILKPEWGTDAAYKVLDNTKVKNNHGRFNQQDLADIWQAAEYDNMHGELLQLMMNFKLCYKLDYCDTYIAPQILPTKQPDYDWDSNNNTVLRYDYEFMPKGMMTQFIVAIHKHIEHKQQRVWKEGVVLQKDNTRAEVIEEYEKREIHIHIQGQNRRELATIILHEWDKIHAKYHNLKVQKLIPCNCAKCEGTQQPYFHIYSELLNLKTKSNVSQCKSSGELLNVQKLLGDVLIQTEKQDNGVNVDVKVMQVQGDTENTNINQGDHVQQQLAEFAKLSPQQQAQLLAQLQK